MGANNSHQKNYGNNNDSNTKSSTPAMSEYLYDLQFQDWQDTTIIPQITITESDVSDNVDQLCWKGLPKLSITNNTNNNTDELLLTNELTNIRILKPLPIVLLDIIVDYCIDSYTRSLQG